MKRSRRIDSHHPHKTKYKTYGAPERSVEWYSQRGWRCGEASAASWVWLTHLVEPFPRVFGQEAHRNVEVAPQHPSDKSCGSARASPRILAMSWVRTRVASGDCGIELLDRVTFKARDCRNNEPLCLAVSRLCEEIASKGKAFERPTEDSMSPPKTSGACACRFSYIAAASSSKSSPS